MFDKLPTAHVVQNHTNPHTFHSFVVTCPFLPTVYTKLSNPNVANNFPGMGMSTQCAGGLVASNRQSELPEAYYT